MTNEFDIFKNNIKDITRQEFNTNFPLCGKIIGNTPNYEYCDVEVETHSGKYTFTNVPAHGFPVPGTSGIIHFHNGNIEQPVCDCAYRLNPSTEVLKEYYTSECFNWHNNGDFSYDKDGYNDDSTFELIKESYTLGGDQCAILRKYGDTLSFDCDMSQCTTEYFKFQCYYKGAGQLKIECHDKDTGEIIKNLPYTLSFDYKIWTSPFGRYGWAYNKEVYPYLSQDHSTTHENITITITNDSTETEELTFNNETFDENGYITGEEQEPRTVKAPISMLVDGLLVYSESAAMDFYPSSTDCIKSYSLEQ